MGTTVTALVLYETRLSPTWPIRNRVSYSTRAVTVVPIPRLSCSVSVRWKMAPFAARIDVRIRSATWSSERLFNDPSSRATKRTAISLATSPAACPPMPSATTKIPRSGTMRKLSSFPERIMPTSVRPAQVICTGRRRSARTRAARPQAARSRPERAGRRPSPAPHPRTCRWWNRGPRAPTPLPDAAAWRGLWTPTDRVRPGRCNRLARCSPPASSPTGADRRARRSARGSSPASRPLQHGGKAARRLRGHERYVSDDRRRRAGRPPGPTHPPAASPETGLGGGRGLRRASGRPRWRGGSRRGGRRVRIEAKLLVAQSNHVGPGEDPLTLHALLVHERPVGTRVDQQIALWRLDDLGVPARNVLPRYHHVAPRLAAEHQRRRGDHVLTAVREAYDPTARHADGRRFGAGLGRSGGRRRGERLHEIGRAHV